MGESMPKYRYGCSECGREWWQWGAIADQVDSCPHCNTGKPEKLPVSFVVVTKADSEEKTAKENVVDHIEENRQILKKMRETSKEKDVFNDD